MKRAFGVFKTKLFSAYAIYLGSNIIGSVIPFLFLPILTRYLSPADYGKVATFQVLLHIFLVLIGLNIHGAASRAYFELDSRRFKQFNYNLILIAITSFATILVMAEVYIRLGLALPDLNSRWLLLIAITALFEAWSALLLSIWRVQEKPFQFGKFQITKVAINISLSVLLVVILDLTWKGRLISISLTNIAFGSIALYGLFRKRLIEPRFNLQDIKDALYFGIPLIPHSLSGWITTYIDRFFIAFMIGMADVGIYSVGYQIGKIIGLVAISFNQAWQPFIFKKLSNGNENDKLNIVKITYLYFLLITILALFLSLIAPNLVAIFLGNEFESSAKYIPWIALGYASDGMYFMVVNYIFFLKKTYYLTLITFTSAFINIILNYIFISWFGTVGAAIATSITSFITFLSVWILSSKIYPMPWFLRI